MTFADGSFVTYEYDEANRLVAIQNNVEERRDITLDAAGNTTHEQNKDAGGAIVYQITRAYDELSRITSIMGVGEQNNTQYAYDVNDNLASSTNGRNYTTSYEYDALHRLQQSLEPLETTTEFDYNQAGQLSTVTDAETLQSHYSYNGFGEVTQLISPDTGITDYSYDQAGNLLSKTDARGVVEQHQYDVLNRLVATAYPAAPENNITYTYDSTASANYGIGRLTAVQDPSGETQFTYNHLGRVVEKTYRINNSGFTTGYHYDTYGRLETLTYPSGRIVSYERDSLGCISGLITQENSTSAPQVLLNNVTYAAFGPVTGWVFGNGVSHSVTLTEDYRLSALSDGGTSLIQNREYSYDGNGNITGITRTDNMPIQQAFDYSALDRLTSATGVYGDIGYRYDKIGNRLERQKTKAAVTEIESYEYAVDSHHLQYIAKTGEDNSSRSFSYAVNGNLLVENSEATTSWQYGASNRPTQVQVGNATTHYKHNVFGQRVEKATAAKSYYYHYDLNGKLLAVSDVDGHYEEEYIWLGGELAGFLEKATKIFSPTITILAPQDSMRALEGEAVTFSAIATDNGEDASDKLQWSSSADGEIGAGAGFTSTS